MKAKRENKVYSITTEQEKQRYLKDGFDIYDDNGILAEYSPKKKISYSQYDALLKENAALRKEREDLKEENNILLEKLELFTEGTGEDKPEAAQPEKKENKPGNKRAGG